MHKKNVIIIRHGRSKHNLGLTKNLNSEISDYGQTMAMAVGRFLKTQLRTNAFGLDPFRNESFEIYTSPYLRCLQTTELICANAGILPQRVNVDPRLREYNGHAMAWGDEAQVTSYHGSSYGFGQYNWRLMEQHRSFSHEVNEELHGRLLSFFEESGNNVIVVSHGLPCLTLAHIAKDPTMHYIPLWDNSINNASITWLKNGRGVWWGRTLQHERVEDMGP